MPEPFAEVLLTPAFLEALGRVTVQFATLESEIESEIGLLIGGDQRLGRILTADRPFGGLLDLLSSLFRYRVKSEVLHSELDSLIRRARAIEQKRNTVTHSHWGIDGKGDTATRFKKSARKGKGLVYRSEQMRPSDIQAIADEAGKATGALVHFFVYKVYPHFSPTP